MTEEEFLRTQNAAVREMRQMNSRTSNGTSGNMPPIPSFVRVPNAQNEPRPQIRAGIQTENQKPSTHTAEHNAKPENKQMRADADTNSGKINTPFGGIRLPFLDNLKTDSDLTLIIGLLLILISEKADKKLIFALIYILM